MRNPFAREFALNAKYPNRARCAGAQQRNATAGAVREGIGPAAPGGNWIGAARRRWCDGPPCWAPPTGRTDGSVTRVEPVMGTLVHPASGLRVSATFPGRPEEVRRVREMLQPLLQGCPAADEAVLCASELATNALLHSETREAGGTFTVRAEIRPGESVTIEVEDDGGCWAEPRRHPSCGRGLDIVEALTDDWGVCDFGKRRVVWARLGWTVGLRTRDGAGRPLPEGMPCPVPDIAGLVTHRRCHGDGQPGLLLPPGRPLQPGGRLLPAGPPRLRRRRRARFPRPDPHPPRRNPPGERYIVCCISRNCAHHERVCCWAVAYPWASR